MILLSLSAQARSAFACGMMPAVLSAHCCCPEAGGDAAAPDVVEPHCCDQLALTDAPLAQVATTHSGEHRLPQRPIDPPPVVSLESPLLPTAFEVGSRRYSSAAIAAARHRESPLYLQTARLRL